MKTIKVWLSMAILIGAVATFTGCNKGPAERTGEKVDRAVERTGDKLEDAAERAKDKVD
jgi:hyperosmotically inducible protein